GGAWEKDPETRAAESYRKIKRAVEAGDPDTARDAYKKALTNPSFAPPEPMLIGWIKEMHNQQAWKLSVPLMRDYIRRYPAKAGRVRLRLAQVLLKDQRPTQALREL